MFNTDDKLERLSQRDIRIILDNMSTGLYKVDVTSDILEVYTRLFNLCENTKNIPKPESFADVWIDNPNFIPQDYADFVRKHRYNTLYRQEAYEYTEYDLKGVMEYRKKKFSSATLGNEYD